MKKLAITVLVALGLFCVGSTHADSAWINDYKKAQEEAKTTNKPVLLNFTGSDWCGYCIMLDRAILSKPEFKDYASKNLVLMEVDFPNRGGARWKAQSIDVKKQNAELAEKYDVMGFPTLVILSPEGKMLWRFEGYYSAGVSAFLAELDKARKG
ncbi:MAG TPA: thioredoxin family protein [Chthoniobacterales bacterium]|nr:thioredoxin family protein [Chthoniobacterales bacterium]